MSENKRPPREWRLYVTDMIEFCEKVLAYTSGLSQDAFGADALTFDATLRNLELIGEAGTHVPSWVREAYPSIPWREIIALRNRLIHVYVGVDQDVVWDIIQTDIPNLLLELRSLLDLESKEAHGSPEPKS